MSYVLFLGGVLLAASVFVSMWGTSWQQRKKTDPQKISLENLKFAFDQHAIVSIANSDRTIIYANDKFFELMEYTEKQILGKSRDLINSNLHDQNFFAEIWSTVGKGRVWQGEICNKSSRGKLYWLESTFVPIFNCHGFLDQCIIIETDITCRKSLERDLESSRAYLQSVTDSMGEGIYTLDANGNCTFLNAEGERLIGWSFEEVKGHYLHNVIHYQDGNGLPIPAHECPILHALQQGRKLQCEDQFFTHKDGRIFPVSLISVRLEQNGTFIGSVLVFQDITERRRIQDALQKSEQRLKFALNASETGLWDYNPITGETFFSDTYFTMLGYKPGAFLPSMESLRSLMNADDRVSFEKVFAEHISGKSSTIAVEFRLKRQDGSWVWIKSIGRITDRREDGTPLRITGIHIDVSAAQKSQAELADAKEVAIQASQAKSNFLALMSHEIRTPLNGIIGLSHLMGCTELEPRQQDYLKKIQIASKSLLAIINDILDFSKIEASKLTIEMTNFDLDELLENVTSMIGPKIREKGLELVICREPRMHQTLLGDPLRLGQVLLNLLSNAAKFTSQGEIVVKVDGQAIDTTQYRVDISVSDTGIGMSDAQCAALFQPFAQADASISRRFGGTGLGLAISKQLIALLGGSIDVRSAEGQGTTFFFSIPMSVSNHQGPRSASAHLLTGKRILVADDSLAARTFLQNWLDHFGLDVEICTDAREALQKLEADRGFDLILLDFPIAGLDDPALLQSIWKTALFTPIIITTTQRKEDLETQLRNITTGFEHQSAAVASIIEKPLLPNLLLENLAAVFRPDSREAVNRSNVSRQLTDINWPGARVLLVEDNSLNQQVATELLESLRIEVSVAGCGRAAIAILREQKFDLILMDLHMPGMDGFETATEVRSTLGVVDTPIIAVSADLMTGLHERCLQAGMDDYIAKPIDPANLVCKLTRWLNKFAVKAGSPRVGNESQVTLDRSQHPPDIRSLDMELGLRNLNGNRALLIELLRNFICEQTHQVVSMKQAAKDSDWLSLHHIAHSLKGCSATLGASQISSIAGELERLGGAAGKTGSSALVDDLLEKLERAFRIARADVSNLTANVKKIPCMEPASSIAEIRHIIDRLSSLLQDANPDAEQQSDLLAQCLANTNLASRCLDLHRLTSRFDFSDAQKLLNEISSALENVAAP